jgi:hypothetical protein
LLLTGSLTDLVDAAAVTAALPLALLAAAAAAMHAMPAAAAAFAICHAIPYRCHKSPGTIPTAATTIPLTVVLRRFAATDGGLSGVVMKPVHCPLPDG